MTGSDTSARERRAAARAQRRDGQETTDDNGANSVARAQDALRNAASAAAVGAAVGAARALSARRQRDRADDDEPPAEPELQQTPEPEPAEEHAEDYAEQPQPASAGDLRSIVRRARALLGDLHGTDAESVSSVARTRNGWTVGLEVVEVRRIPDSTDILATYEVELDGDGNVARFERTRRYHRAEADRGGR